MYCMANQYPPPSIYSHRLLVPVVALCLSRRTRRPLLAVVDALAALDTDLAPAHSSGLSAVTDRADADTHGTLNRHLSLLLSLNVTRGRPPLSAFDLT